MPQGEISNLPKTEGHSTGIWQERLLPFMTGTLIVLGLFFFLASALQIYHLYNQMEKGPKFDDMPTFFKVVEDRFFSGQSKDPRFLEYLRLKSHFILEDRVVKHRYHQANITLMARVWIKYAGFVTGMILAMVG